LYIIEPDPSALKLITGIGKITAGDIVREIHKNNGMVNFSGFWRKKFYGPLKQLSELITSLMELQQNPVQAIEIILDFYKPILESIEVDYEARFQDLEILLNLASKYNSVEQIVSDFTLEPPSNKFQEKLLPLPGEPEEKPMTVSTIHSAKGLE
jgi:DNA helicase II / ATP-dependent DNA helicase PcrA